MIRVNQADAVRQLDKAVTTLEKAAEHHLKRDESNAALHLSDRVLYTPLTTELVSAHQAALQVRDALMRGDIE